MDEQYIARRNVRELPNTIQNLNDHLSKLTADEKIVNANTSDRITIGNRTWQVKDALATLGDRLDALPKQVKEPSRMLIGIYRGLRFGIVLHPSFPPDVYLEGATTRSSKLSRDHQGPRAVLNALERLATGYSNECEHNRRDLAIAESQLRDYQARLGKPFAHEAYLSELTDLRDQLKAALSEGNTESDDDSGPDSLVLADKIKTLKAANTIEATPQRKPQKNSIAEEPVTARIRRRAEVHTAHNQTIHSDATGSPTLTFPSSESTPQDSSVESSTMFQERIISERRRGDDGKTLQ